MDIKCPHCGQVIVGEQDFCPFCMEQLPIYMGNNETTAKKGSSIADLLREFDDSNREKIARFNYHRRITIIWMGISCLIMGVFAGYCNLTSNLKLLISAFPIFLIAFIGSIIYGAIHGSYSCPLCGGKIAKHYHGVCLWCHQRIDGRE